MTPTTPHARLTAWNRGDAPEGYGPECAEFRDDLRVVLGPLPPTVVTLADCPIGLFRWGSLLCLKTEYGNNEGRIDAYIVDTGEFFWGASPQTIASQRAQMVVPVTHYEIRPVGLVLLGDR